MRLPVAMRGEVSSVGRDVCCSPRAAEVCREAQTMNGYLNLVRRYNEEGVEWGSWKANQESATNLNISKISFSHQNLDLRTLCQCSKMQLFDITVSQITIFILANYYA